jgi:hypothetical protein
MNFIEISYDGVSLTDEASGIMLQPPVDMGTPPIRGEDVVVPFRHGAVSVPKFYGPRSVVLNGFVFVDPGQGQGREVLWARMDALKRLLSIASQGPRKLSFGWPDGTNRYLLAEVKNTLGLSGEHTTFSPVSIEFTCADPFFRDDAAAQEPPLKLNDPRHLKLNDPHFFIADHDASYDEPIVDAGDVALAVPNPGVVPIEDMIIRLYFHQACTNVAIRCPAAGTTLNVTGPFAAGDTLAIDCRTWRCTLNEHTDIGDRLTTGLGQRAPLILPPDTVVGSNTVVVNLTLAGALDTTKNIANFKAKYAACYL